MEEIVKFFKKLVDDNWVAVPEITYLPESPSTTLEANKKNGKMSFCNECWINLKLIYEPFEEKPVRLILYGPLEGPSRIQNANNSLIYTSAIIHTASFSSSGVMEPFETKDHSYSYSDFMNFTIKELLLDILV
jgi:hypothetical protein